MFNVLIAGAVLAILMITHYAAYIWGYVVAMADMIDRRTEEHLNELDESNQKPV